MEKEIKSGELYVGGVDSEHWKMVLRRRKTMKDRFKIPYSFEMTKSILYSAIAVEVELRNRILRVSPDVDEQVSRVSKWLIGYDFHPSIMLCGCYGNGKSTMLNAVINTIQQLNNWMRLGQERYSIRLEDVKSLLYLHQTDIKKYLELKYIDILGIDDLGKETTETLEYGNVFTPIVDLLEDRYEHQNTTIITTNLTPHQIREKYGDRIADRFNEIMSVVVFRNNSYRTPLKIHVPDVR